MPEIFRALGLVFSIFPDDHDPPHVHIQGAGWWMKITLSEPPDLRQIIGKATKRDARKALRLTREYQARLMTAWENIHGRLG